MNFGRFSKEKASELIGNKLELSLLMAEKFLLNVPEKMNPTTANYNRLEFEMMAEGVLYFIIGARDALLQKINKNLSLGLDEDNVDLFAVLGKLDKTDTIQKDVHRLLNDCTQPPQRGSSGWIRDKSWLWEINHIRNRIGHISILSSAVSVSVGSGQDPQASMIIYTPKKYFQNDPIKEAKSNEYFTQCYKKFVELKEAINKLLPQSP